MLQLEMIEEEKQYIQKLAEYFVFTPICCKFIYPQYIYEQLQFKNDQYYKPFENDSRSALNRNEYLLFHNFMYIDGKELNIPKFQTFFFLSFFTHYGIYNKTIQSLRKKQYVKIQYYRKHKKIANFKIVDARFSYCRYNTINQYGEIINFKKEIEKENETL